MNTDTIQIPAETADLLRRLREACQSADHPLTSALSCGYCIEIGEILGDR